MPLTSRARGRARAPGGGSRARAGPGDGAGGRSCCGMSAMPLGTARHGRAQGGTAWLSMARDGTAWLSVAWHGMAWLSMAQLGTAWHGSGENLANGREKHNKPRADGAGKAGFLTPAGTVGFPYCSAAQVLFM